MSDFSYTIPGYAFLEIGIVAYIFGLFSNTMGAIIHLCNAILLFSHFWLLVPLITTGVYQWLVLVILEFSHCVLSFIMCIIEFMVACRDENETEGYKIQQDQ